MRHTMTCMLQKNQPIVSSSAASAQVLLLRPRHLIKTRLLSGENYEFVPSNSGLLTRDNYNSALVMRSCFTSGCCVSVSCRRVGVVSFAAKDDQ